MKVTDEMVERAYQALNTVSRYNFTASIRIALEAALADIPEPSAPRRFTEAERSALQAAIHVAWSSCCVYADKKTDYICPTTSPCNCRVYTALLNEFSDPPAPPKCKHCGLPIKQHWRVFVHVGTGDARCAYSYAKPEDAQ